MAEKGTDLCALVRQLDHGPVLGKLHLPALCLPPSPFLLLVPSVIALAGQALDRGPQLSDDGFALVGLAVLLVDECDEL